jgi:hypothetical protein
MHVQLKLCLSRAKADTAALQQELKVFHTAEDRLKSLNLDHYQDGVLERIAQAVLKGNLDRTMDAHMLVSLAHNANLDASSKQRRFGNQLMRFWTYVFGQNSGAGAYRAATARHSDAIPGERPVVNMLNCPSPEALRSFGGALDDPDDIRLGGVYLRMRKRNQSSPLARRACVGRHAKHGIKPLDKVCFCRRKLGDNTLQVKKPNKLCATMAEALREHKFVTRLPPQLGCPGREICPQQRQQGAMQAKHGAIGRCRVRKRSASQTNSVTVEGAEKKRKAELLIMPVVAHHSDSSSYQENCVEQAD